MELNNLPLPLKISIKDFIEDGNMIQLKFNILGYLKKEAWLCEGSDAKHSATIQLLVSSYFQYYSLSDEMTVNKVLLNLPCQII